MFSKRFSTTSVEITATITGATELIFAVFFVALPAFSELIRSNYGLFMMP